MLFDPQHLQDIIACPKTKAKLICEGEFLISVDPETRLKYPIKDGIPIMQRHQRNPESGELVS